MTKTTIIVELIDEKQLAVSGPLEHDRDLCVKMLREALKVVETYAGGVIAIPQAQRFISMDQQKQNHLIRKDM